MNSCKRCRHIGKVFEHLKGFDEVAEWRACKYPLPWHVSARAVPMVKDAGNECEAFQEKEAPSAPAKEVKP